MDENAALVLERVTARSLSGTTLTNLDLSVKKGSFHGLLGFGASGKSLTLQIAAGRVKPQSGGVEILGKQGPGFSGALLRRIGYQPQVPAFIPKMTAWEQLQTIAGAYGVPRKRLEVLFEALDLESCRNQRVEVMTQRQTRLLSIAAAVVHTPEFLVLDEPTYGLEIEDRKRVISVLRSSNVAGMTTLFATRNLDELERLCDEVTILGAGATLTREGQLQ